MEMSKGDFASHIGVSPGRVSQYIASGIIGPDALSGEGRSARVVVEKAVEQIAARRHVGQALGNGLSTRLNFDAPSAQPGDVPPSIPTNDPARLIQLEKLEQERRRNRLATIDEAKALGELVPVEDFQREVGKVSQTLVNTFTGMAPDIANAIAAKFGLPTRDVLHLVKQVMTEKRRDASAEQRKAGEAMTETVEAVIS